MADGSQQRASAFERLPDSAFELFEAEDSLGDAEAESAGVSLDVNDSDEYQLLADKHARGAGAGDDEDGPAGAALTIPMAYRVLRDSIALQLARRGFDGLRMQPLSLVAEMAACFIVAIGTQLARVDPAPAQASTSASASGLAPPLPTVLRLQRHTNLRTPAEWHKLNDLFSRKTELNTMAGTAAAQLVRQKQPCLGGRPPPSLQQLYIALRATWHYKMTAAGRHAACGDRAKTKLEEPSSPDPSLRAATLVPPQHPPATRHSLLAIRRTRSRRLARTHSLRSP